MNEFKSFKKPEQNWSKLPHQLIDALPAIETIGEMKIVFYMIYHFWGSLDNCKYITLDELQNGRKNKSGTRLDDGTGLSKPTVIDGVKRGIAHKYIVKESPVSPNEIVNILKTKIPQHFPMGNDLCNWCNGRTLKLQAHHFPIAEKDGGTDTVTICANCHFEYHILADIPRYRLNEVQK